MNLYSPDKGSIQNDFFFKQPNTQQPNIAVKTKVVNATRQRKLYNTTLFSRVDLVKFHHDEVQYVLYIMLGKQSADFSNVQIGHKFAWPAWVIP